MSAPEDEPGLEDARRQVQELRQALTRRTVIARAQGVLMERYGLAEGAAIGVLKRISMETQVKVHDLAARVLDGATIDELRLLPQPAED